MEWLYSSNMVIVLEFYYKESKSVIRNVILPYMVCSSSNWKQVSGLELITIGLSITKRLFEKEYFIMFIVFMYNCIVEMSLLTNHITI